MLKATVNSIPCLIRLKIFAYFLVELTGADYPLLILKFASHIKISLRSGVLFCIFAQLEIFELPLHHGDYFKIDEENEKLK